MKILLPFLLLTLASIAFVRAEYWTTDYKAALAQAKQQNKLVLLDFTGSDWCPGCMLLAKEVFPDPAFKAFVTKNFVPVTIDFPNGTKLSDAVALQNDKLQDHFKVEVFPTLIVVDPDGKEIGRFTGEDIGHKASDFNPKNVVGLLLRYTKK